MASTTIDIISVNPTTGEYILILVEDGPWPDELSHLGECLTRIQNRIYDSIDIAIDGHLAAKYPDAKGKPVRVQVDSPHGAPQQLRRLIVELRTFLNQKNGEYDIAINKSIFVTDVRLVMGDEI